MALTDRGRNRPPVMTDVAQLAGVSHQTVSRVLNDHPNVRPQTRELVLAAISRARLPAERRGPHPGHPAHPHPRRDQLRHHPVRPGLHALRNRAGRPGHLLRLHRQRPDPGPPLRAGRGGPLRRGRAWRESSSSPPQISAVEALADCPSDIPLVAVGCRTTPAAALGRGGQHRRGRGGHPLPARPGPPHRAPPGRAALLAGRRGPGGGLAAGAARGGGRRAGPGLRRLVGGVRVRDGAADRAGRQRDRRVLR